MKKQFIISALALLIALNLAAQEEKQGGLKVTSFGLSFGFAGAGTANTNEDFMGLAGAVNDPDLFINPDDYKRSQFNFGFGGNVSPKLYLGLTPYSKKRGEYRYDRELRFSFGTAAGIRRNFDFYRYHTFTIDTLQSGTTGNQVIADSSIYDHYLYTESFNEFNLGVAYIFKTPVTRRFHFTAGAGFEYAYAFRAFVNVENYNDRFVYYYEPGDKPVFDDNVFGFGYYGEKYFDGGTTTSDKTNLTGSIHFIRIHVPLGIHFRISRKPSSFFNKAYLFGEMNPGIEFQFVANDKNYTNPYFGLAMFGFAYRW